MSNTSDTPAVACRQDCRFYSTYTNTCDYTLLMYRTRGCPHDACTKYEPRSAAGRAPSAAPFDPEDGLCIDAKEDPMPNATPEPRLDAPDDGRFITAGCGHEVYEGEELYGWDDDRTLCAECFEQRFNELSLGERAELLGCEHAPVVFPSKRSV